MSKMATYGRITKDLELRYMKNEKQTAIVEFSIAEKKSGSTDSQFLNFTAFGKTAENLERFFRKGSRIVVYSHPDIHEYTNKDGNKVRATKFVVESFEFVDTKSEGGASAEPSQPTPPPLASQDFMNIPDDVSDDSLPFN